MNRRVFVISAGVAASIASMQHTLGHQASPVAAADLPTLDIEFTDDGIVSPETVATGLVALTVRNTGSNPASHWLMARLPDGTTDADIEGIFTEDEADDAFAFEDLGFVGVPDWPAPGGEARGVVNLDPGAYLLLDVFGGRGMSRIVAEGEPQVTQEPDADLTVTLKDMTISLPEAAFTSEPQRWKIENIGSVPHDVAVIPVDADLTDDDLLWLLSLPDDATPTPGGPWLEYQPVAAIGVLRSGAASWLDVSLSPGRYVAICMLPFGTGYPHAMDGMFVFFDVA